MNVHVMKTFLLPILIILILTSCRSKKSDDTAASSFSDSIPEVPEETSFPSLAPGEVELHDNAFGDIIELTGASHPVDQLFKVKETQLLAKASMLIIKNQNEDKYFMAFSLPDFSHIKSFGRRGKGPGELVHPSVIAGNVNDIIVSIYDVNGKVYHVNKSFELEDAKISFDVKRQLYDQNKICAASAEEYYYVGVAPVAKEIYKYSANDSIPETSVKQLSVKGFKGWASYTGYLGANFNKDRLVFAYKYFRKIVFTDLSGKVERTINFDTNSKTEKQSNVSILGPASVTYYWGMSAQEDYVYLLYSGRTPMVVTEELREGSGYIYVEQFDWNGNPIRKYRLDHWGYFCVDDKEENIYIASTTDEHPLYSYKLPGNQVAK